VTLEHLPWQQDRTLAEQLVDDLHARATRPSEHALEVRRRQFANVEAVRRSIRAAPKKR